MKIRQIVELLEGKLLTSPEHMDYDIPCGFSCDLISDILMCVTEPTLILTGVVNHQIVRLADMIEIMGIVFVRGKRPPQERIEMARERDLPLVSTPYTMFKSSALLYNAGLRSCSIQNVDE